MERHISIHAPLTGSDKCSHFLRRRTGIFQSTLPSQGATYAIILKSLPCSISIHAPLTGSDSADLELFLHNEYFNPRSPHRERPSSRFTLSIMRYFNPRSPHRERRLFWVICWVFSRFQSTLPSQGATISQSFMYSKINISIHAPLTGSDGDRPHQGVHV